MSFVTIPSPLRACSVRNGDRALPLRASSPTGRASRRFAFARNGHAPTTSFGPALAVKNGGCGTTLALPASRQTRPCLLGVGFPPSGPRVWTCTSWSWFMPITHAAQSVLRPLCLLSGLAAQAHVGWAEVSGSSAEQRASIQYSEADGVRFVGHRDTVIGDNGSAEYR